MSREDIPGGKTLQIWRKGLSKAETRMNVFGCGRAFSEEDLEQIWKATGRILGMLTFRSAPLEAKWCLTSEFCFMNFPGGTFLLLLAAQSCLKCLQKQSPQFIG